MQQSTLDDIDHRLDMIFDTIDSFLCSGNFETVDTILTGVDVNNRTIDELIGYMVATLPAKNKLKCRKPLLEQIKGVKGLPKDLLIGLD